MRILGYCNFIFLIFFLNSLTLKAQAIDLASEPAFAPRTDSLVENNILLSMKIISPDQMLIASDLYDRCNPERGKNIYVILAIDLLNRTVTNRRIISALPGSFDLILDVNHRPLLISQSSIQVLNPKSLDTAETLTLDGAESSMYRGAPDEDRDDCAEINFRTSTTPDSKHIMVAVAQRRSQTTNLYQIDGETLGVTRKSIIGYMPNFQIGFEGIFEQSHRRQWNWVNGNGDIPVCMSCDFLDVLSVNSIVTMVDTRVSVQSGARVVWSTSFAGMRDSFASDQRGNRFALLATTGVGPFNSLQHETLFIFDVTKRKVRRIQNFSVKQSGSVRGSGRSAIAWSNDGVQVVIFLGGRLTVISHM
jgi:hypothetical protein